MLDILTRNLFIIQNIRGVIHKNQTVQYIFNFY